MKKSKKPEVQPVVEAPAEQAVEQVQAPEVVSQETQNVSAAEVTQDAAPEVKPEVQPSKLLVINNFYNSEREYKKGEGMPLDHKDREELLRLKLVEVV